MAKTVIIAFLGNVNFDARCLNMANTLYKNGYNVTIIDELSDEEGFQTEKFDIIHVNTKYKSGLLRYWNFHCKVQSISKKINPDIFIAGDLFSLAVCTKQKMNCIKIFDCREIYSKLTALINKPFKQSFWSFYEKLYFNKVDKVFVTATSDKEFLLKKYGKKEIFEILNFPKIVESTLKINIREKYNIPKENKIFIYQGAIQFGRGIDEMIFLLKEFPKITALIVGTGSYKTELIKLIEKYKVSDRVIFTGVVPYLDLISYTKQADIGFSLIQPVSQSYKQALPNKLFEYGLSGIPTIASNFPEIDKYVNQYKLGLTVNPENYESQKNVVEQLLNWRNREQLKNIVQNNFTWEAQETKFLELIKFK